MLVGVDARPCEPARNPQNGSLLREAHSPSRVRERLNPRGRCDWGLRRLDRPDLVTNMVVETKVFLMSGHDRLAGLWIGEHGVTEVASHAAVAVNGTVNERNRRQMKLKNADRLLECLHEAYEQKPLFDQFNSGCGVRFSYEAAALKVVKPIAFEPPEEGQVGVSLAKVVSVMGRA